MNQKDYEDIKEELEKEKNKDQQRESSDLKAEKEKLQTQLNEKDRVIADLQKPSVQVIEEIKEKTRKKSREIKIMLNN